MTESKKLFSGDMLFAIVLAVVTVLVAGMGLLTVARLTSPTASVKAAFVDGGLLADEAAYRAYAKLGRVKADCDIAGQLVKVNKTFYRYLFAPQVPKDPDLVLSTCQLTRDLAFADSNTGFAMRSVDGNPVGLRALTRLTLSVAPMIVWQISLAVIALLICISTAFVEIRRGTSSVLKLSLLSAAGMIAIVFGATSLSLGLGALLWPLAFSLVFLTGGQPVWRTLLVSAVLGATAVIFDYSAALGFTVLVSLMLAMTAQGLSGRDLLRNLIVYVLSAILVVLVLAVASAIARGMDAPAAVIYVSEQFTDIPALLGAGSGDLVAQDSDRLVRMLTNYNGWLALGFYGWVIVMIFAGWAIGLKGAGLLGRALVLSVIAAVIWAVLCFDRVTSQPMQFASLPLLLFAYAVTALLVTLLWSRPASRESAK